jgi:hypothetical protein
MTTLFKELHQRNKNVKNYSELLIQKYGYNWNNMPPKFMVALNNLIGESALMTNNNNNTKKTNNLPELSHTQWRNILNCYIELYKGVEPKNVTNSNLYDSTLMYMKHKLLSTNNGTNNGNRSKRNNNMLKFKNTFKKYNKTHNRKHV